MYLALSLFTGFLVALMIQFNGILQEATGGSLALLSIHLCGLSGALLFLFAARGRLTGDPKQKSPVYCLTAGMLGTVLVYIASVTFSKGGILFSLSGSLAGQTLAASIAEGFYKEGRERSTILQRILTPVLLISASFIIGFKVNASIIWIIFSWSPGIILMIQQTMNARNTLYYGTPKTVLFNYVSALIIIIPLFFITGGEPAAAVETISILPWYIFAGGGLIGVFTTGSISFLLLKAPALLVILGIYAGQLAGGMILDLYNGNPMAIEKIISILLIAIGFGSGRIKLRPLKT